MRARRVSWVTLAAVLAAVAVVSAGEVRSPFPHEKHDRLFPVCEGCHAGVFGSDREAIYPTAATCERCHDGGELARVNWTPPRIRVSNLRFSHLEHRESLERDGSEEPALCQRCHASIGAEKRMDVGAPQPELCIGCHAHRATSHFAAEARCTSCHQPLSEAARYAVTDIAALPRPEWHEGAGFLSAHGRLPQPRAASCATCHARESCERCHANADRLAPITDLPRDRRVAQVERNRAPRYPVPPAHLDVSWRLVHGDSARRSAQSCANCHTRPSCTNCHMGGVGAANAAVASLPVPRRGGATGVVVDRERAPVHPANFSRRHSTAAATGQVQCAQCHSSQSCSNCHAGQDSRAFHAANFVERHATDVFAASSSCRSCHSTESFCRDCHAKSGVAAGAGMSAAFHDGQANWILSHGQAARLGMQSCASCHRQGDCIRCHSATGGWGVNPHGPGFQADRLGSRSSPTCAVCHTGSTGRGR
jgi:predicted CXXCH cytochrome family protein